jgi:hypothetical protein
VQTGGNGEGSHWDEGEFDDEMMTTLLESDGGNPLSIMSIGALADLGYAVNYGAAEPYELRARSLHSSGHYINAQEYLVNEPLVVARLRR